MEDIKIKSVKTETKKLSSELIKKCIDEVINGKTPKAAFIAIAVDDGVAFVPIGELDEIIPMLASDVIEQGIKTTKKALLDVAVSQYLEKLNELASIPGIEETIKQKVQERFEKMAQEHHKEEIN